MGAWRRAATTGTRGPRTFLGGWARRRTRVILGGPLTRVEGEVGKGLGRLRRSHGVLKGDVRKRDHCGVCRVASVTKSHLAYEKQQKD